MFVKYIFFAALIGTAVSQIEFTLPPDFTFPPGMIGPNIDINQLLGMQNQTTPAIKKKCDENGGPEAYERFQMGFQEFTICVQSLVDVMKLQQEIEQAKPNGQVDEVFKKYCAKTPAFKTCFRNLTETMKPCFAEKERANLQIVYNVTEQLAEFICYKEGDRIALFIAEGGQECFTEKQAELQDCVNSTLGSDYQMSPNSFSMESFDLPDLSFGEKECRQMSELQTCVVGALETCPAPTTGNIVESLFKFIRKATPCSDAGQESKKKVPGAASGLAVTSATILLALIASIFV